MPTSSDPDKQARDERRESLLDELAYMHHGGHLRPITKPDDDTEQPTDEPPDEESDDDGEDSR